jgi:hypothetical protein
MKNWNLGILVLFVLVALAAHSQTKPAAAPAPTPAATTAAPAPTPQLTAMESTTLSLYDTQAELIAERRGRLIGNIVAEHPGYRWSTTNPVGLVAVPKPPAAAPATPASTTAAAPSSPTPAAK